MLEPKRIKYRKHFRGRMKGKSLTGSEIDFGDFGLKSLGRAWVSAAQIEAARRAITHWTKRKAKVWVRVFPDKPVTKKAAGAPMGGGKGDLDRWVAVVKPGRVLFEISGVPVEIAEEALRRAGHKLPIKTKVVFKEEK